MVAIWAHGIPTQHYWWICVTTVIMLDADNAPGSLSSTVHWQVGPVGLFGRLYIPVTPWISYATTKLTFLWLRFWWSFFRWRYLWLPFIQDHMFMLFHPWLWCAARMSVCIFPHLHTAIIIFLRYKYMYSNVRYQSLVFYVFRVKLPSSGNIHLESYACYCQMSCTPPLLNNLIVKIEIKISKIKFQSLCVDWHHKNSSMLIKIVSKNKLKL
jgi:hypothetical protein